MKKEVDSHNKKQLELEEMISEMELARLEMQREIAKIKEERDTARQGQESYKSLLNRIKNEKNLLSEFHSPYSFGDKESPLKTDVTPNMADNL